MKLKTGTVIDGYKILAEAGSGACGTVYQAVNTISNEIVALKVIPCQGSLPERELNALKLYQQLEHPHLIRVRHIGTCDDHIYYTMDWCESSLAQRKVSADELLEIAEGIADALKLLHEKGLIHRDIKPDNIFFRQGKAILGDVGLLTNLSTATFAGSPGFLAPSLLQGHAPDMYSDCYALAKTLYCALSGQEPTQFPVYEGDLTPSAAKLMQCILSVCGVEPKIRTAEGILDFLDNPSAQTPVSHKKKYPVYFFAAFVIIMLCAGTAFFLFPRDRKINPVSATEEPSAGEKIAPVSLPEPVMPPAETRIIPEIRTVARETPVPDKTEKTIPAPSAKKKKKKFVIPEYITYPPDVQRKMKVKDELHQFSDLFSMGTMTGSTLREEIAKEFPECTLSKKQEERWERMYQEWIQKSMTYQKQVIDEYKQTGESVLSIWERVDPHDPLMQLFMTSYADMEKAYSEQNYILLSPEERKPLHEEYRKKLAVFIRERNKLMRQKKY